MSAALQHAVGANEEGAASDAASDWETPAGPLEAAAKPRHTSAAFIYRGYAESHWHGQTCHLIAENAPEERVIVMACGCRASVPWWTLEPISMRDNCKESGRA